MYLHELEIGNVKLKNNIILAPMAGITDLPFRIICEKFEPGLVYSEMVSSKAIFYDDEKTKKLMNLNRRKKTSCNSNIWLRCRGNGICCKVCFEYSRYCGYKYGMPSTEGSKKW